MTFTSILSEARRLVKANSTSFTTADITTSANKALDRIVALIRHAEGRWEFDDTNNSDLPIATSNLVSGQQDYSIGSTFYSIKRVEVLNSSGVWSLLKPIDQADINEMALTQFLSTSGLPKYYDKLGNSIFLYPKPNYSQDSSLKVYFERGADYFTTSDTTKTPGFNPMFHNLVPMWCAYDYALMNNLSIQKNLRAEIGVLEDELLEYYANRNMDEHKRLSTKKYRFN